MSSEARQSGSFTLSLLPSSSERVWSTQGERELIYLCSLNNSFHSIENEVLDRLDKLFSYKKGDEISR